MAALRSDGPARSGPVLGLHRWPGGPTIEPSTVPLVNFTREVTMSIGLQVFSLVAGSVLFSFLIGLAVSFYPSRYTRRLWADQIAARLLWSNNGPARRWAVRRIRRRTLDRIRGRNLRAHYRQYSDVEIWTRADRLDSEISDRIAAAASVL